jgi:flavin-dependent dehydrogenase
MASGAPAIRTMSFHTTDEPPQVREVQARAGVDHLLAPRRHILDEILLDAARRAGAEVETGVTVTEVMTDHRDRVVGLHLRERSGRERAVQARAVIGADGVRSRIARAVSAPALDARPDGSATHYLYVRGLDGDGFEFHIGARGLAGLFQTHDGEANVWICVPAARALRGRAATRPAAFVELLATIAPDLAARVRGATITAPVRSAVGLPNHVLQAAGPGWALVGDAGHHRDPLTGHGITDAFRDAELLAYYLGPVLWSARSDTQVDHALARYADDHVRHLRPIFDLTCAMSAYPPPAVFAELQRRFSAQLEAEADWLAARPPIRERDRVAA